MTKEIPLTEDITPLLALTDESQVAKLVAEGLPSDSGSVENGTIVTSTLRWPLFIDPQLQGLHWLQQRASMAADKVAGEDCDVDAVDTDFSGEGKNSDGGGGSQDGNIMVIQIGGDGTSRLSY